jgi:hypothetical protein
LIIRINLFTGTKGVSSHHAGDRIMRQNNERLSYE